MKEFDRGFMMSKFYLSRTSKERMRGVHPDLVCVVKRGIELTEVDFRVNEGKRNKTRQKELVDAGASKTMDSLHIPHKTKLCVTGEIPKEPVSHAVDLVALVGNKVSWDWPVYDKIAKAMKKAAKELGIEIEWGGDWKTFKDGPHFQLPKRKYRA